MGYSARRGFTNGKISGAARQVNPQAARERVTAYEPITKSKKVLIVGGGVAGCEAARVLAIRGHKPELFEKAGRLGGKNEPAGLGERS